MPDLYNQTDRFHLIGYTNSSYLSFLLGLSSFRLGLSLLKKKKKIKFIRQWIRYDPPASDKARHSVRPFFSLTLGPCRVITSVMIPDRIPFTTTTTTPDGFPKRLARSSARFYPAIIYDLFQLWRV